MILFQKAVDMVLDKLDPTLDTIKTVSLLDNMIKRNVLGTVTQLFFRIDLLELNNATAEYRKCVEVLQGLRQLGFKVFSKDVHIKSQLSRPSSKASVAYYFALSLVSKLCVYCYFLLHPLYIFLY